MYRKKDVPLKITKNNKELGAIMVPSASKILLTMIASMFCFGHTHSVSQQTIKMNLPDLVGKPAPLLANRKEKALQRLAGKYAIIVKKAARAAHVPSLLVASVLHVENRGHINHCANRVSPSGAIGPMQLMPTTAWNYLHVNPWNPKQNIQGGATFLHRLIQLYHGNVWTALVAYNAGPTITSAGHAPEQSLAYANTVMKYYQTNSA